MKLLNNSGPAIFMYSVIAITVIISIVCLHYIMVELIKTE